jgi:hypothetical protein
MLFPYIKTSIFWHNLRVGKADTFYGAIDLRKTQLINVEYDKK